MSLIQLLMTLEEHGVVDMFVSDDQILLLTANGTLELPEWLQHEYELHRADLMRHLRRVRRLKMGKFIVGVCK